MSAPKIRLIDEPSVGLATVLVKRTIEKIKELKDLYQLTALMVEQNFNQAVRIADRESARARRARETRRDQDQVIEIPGLRVRKAAENRTAKGDRHRFPASGGSSASEGQHVCS
jgi:ABC-type branched-subunit amino acid transport system ATPase component